MVGLRSCWLDPDKSPPTIFSLVFGFVATHSLFFNINTEYVLDNNYLIWVTIYCLVPTHMYVSLFSGFPYENIGTIILRPDKYNIEMTRYGVIISSFLSKSLMTLPFDQNLTVSRYFYRSWKLCVVYFDLLAGRNTRQLWDSSRNRIETLILFPEHQFLSSLVFPDGINVLLPFGIHEIVT